jgi:hypothetical protein
MEERIPKPDLALQRLFESAHQDPELRRRLLNDPVTVGKEWKVKFNEDEIMRLKQLGAFMQMSEEIKRGRLFRFNCHPHVCYPIDIWKKQIFVDMVEFAVRDYDVLKKFKDWIFYPAPIFRDRSIFEERLGKLKEMDLVK